MLHEQQLLEILILDFPVADQEYLAKEKEDLFAILKTILAYYFFTEPIDGCEPRLCSDAVVFGGLP